MSLYVITGGAGFIGGHLAAALLRAGHGVRIVDDLSTSPREHIDPDAEFIHADASDAGVVRRAALGAAGMFHLAAIVSDRAAHADWPRAHRVNQAATVAVLDAAREAGRIPVCFASSAAIYGEQGPRAIQEAARPHPRAALAADKLGSEHQAAVAFHAHGVPTLGLRLFHVYGPRRFMQPGQRDVVSIFAERILAGQVITLHGDGLQSRDFIHVGDVVRHFFAGMQMLQRHPQAVVLNACTGRGATIRGLADAIGIVTARIPLVQFGPARLGSPRVILGDPNEAIHVLGVEAGTELQPGLATLFPAPAPSILEWARRAPMPCEANEAPAARRQPRAASVRARQAVTTK